MPERVAHRYVAYRYVARHGEVEASWIERVGAFAGDADTAAEEPAI